MTCVKVIKFEWEAELPITKFSHDCWMIYVYINIIMYASFKWFKDWIEKFLEYKDSAT